jgi:hypothetical protein
LQAPNQSEKKKVETMKKGYRYLVLARANELKKQGSIDQTLERDIESFINNITIEVIPNTGIGQAIAVDENGIPKQEKESPRYSKSRNPVFI